MPRPCVAGEVPKWKGQLLDVDLPHLRRQIRLEASRDHIFAAADIPRTFAQQ
jgi:5-methylthioadenosine/S-adenosylhomocysteine deaminase